MPDTTAFYAPEKSRRIRKRVVVETELMLKSPAHFSNGDSEDIVDMPLLVAPDDGRTPLLTGASIGGALRAFLCNWQYGYGVTETSGSMAETLFGARRADPDGEQSRLIVEDAYGQAPGIEIRDGIRLDPDSGTAAENALFDMQLWPAGTTFPLRFELPVCESTEENPSEHEATLLQMLAIALSGLESGDITLGARKQRGFGQIGIQGWRIKTYDLANINELIDWITLGARPLKFRTGEKSRIDEALDVKIEIPDQRRWFGIDAEFAIQGSILIAGPSPEDLGPDKVHLTSRQHDGEHRPVAPGTSLGGALRSRALKIARTVGEEARAIQIVEDIFGPQAIEGNDDRRVKSGLLGVTEKTVDADQFGLVQSRVSIDRFTGGALDSALFNEQPVFGGTLKLQMTLKSSKSERYKSDHHARIGLLLLLLKDLWTEDLPVGGEKGVGRGRLKGIEANITDKQPEQTRSWRIETEKEAPALIIEGEPQQLEAFVQSHTRYLQGDQGDGT